MINRVHVDDRREAEAIARMIVDELISAHALTEVICSETWASSPTLFKVGLRVTGGDRCFCLILAINHGLRLLDGNYVGVEGRHDLDVVAVIAAARSTMSKLTRLAVGL